MSKEKKNKKSKEVTAPATTGQHIIKMMTGSINLSAFKNKLTKMKTKKGKEIDVLIIPLKSNYLEVAKNGNVYFNIVAWANKTPNDHSTHGVKQQFSKDVRESMSKEEQYDMPFFGNIQALVDSGFKEANNTVEGTDDDFEEDDDMPF